MNRKRNNIYYNIKRNKKINKIIMTGVVAVITGIIVFSATSIAFSSNANAIVPVDGIQCESMEGSLFHIHVKLDIFINGQNFTLPALIGITDNCLYWMHTHDESGIIHIEAPIKKTFTLGQFFDIWKQRLSDNQVLNYTADSNKHPLNVYVNGTKVPNGTEFRNINLHTHDVIAIVYGKSPNIIPAKADFSAVDP